MSKYTILVLTIFCNFSVFSQSIWSIENGWVVRDDFNSENKDLFFAVGLWGIPEYKYIHHDDKESYKFYDSNKCIFNKYSDKFNLIYSHSGYTYNYMNQKVIVPGSSEFPWFIRRYMDSVYNNPNKSTDYKNLNMPLLEKHVNRRLLTKDIDSTIDLVVNSLDKTGVNDYIWTSIDEVASWPPNLIESIYKRIKSRNSNTLVYIDLAGNGKGRSYKNRKKGPIVSNHYDLSFDEEWYKNIKQIAFEYRNGGDVFGINSFSDFYTKPKLAGITVDAIKEGAGDDVPVWLWFDSASYAKPNNVRLDKYFENVKCQIFTSIIHGATGIMFWTDHSKSPKAFDSIKPIIEEVDELLPIIKSKTIDKSSKGDLHYMIKNYNNKRIAIISNTDIEESILITYPTTIILGPLEVFVGEI